MRDSFNPAVVLTAEHEKTLNGVLSDENSSFMYLVEALGLDKADDLRYTDLSGVDFSGSDLRGFDFTGSNLRGAIGVDVRQDASTILIGADLDNSIFAYGADRNRAFEDNPELEREYRLLSGVYYLDQGPMLKNSAMAAIDQAKYRSLCKRLYEETQSATVQTDMLMLLGVISESREKHIEFLLAICQSNVSTSREKYALRQLAEYYHNDAVVFRMLNLYLYHKPADLEAIALQGMLKSKHFTSLLPRIRHKVTTQSTSSARRAYVSAVAKLCGRQFDLCAFDPDQKKYLDFVAAVDLRTIENIAFNLRLDREFEHLYETEAEKLVLANLVKLARRLVPFRFTKRLDTRISRLKEEQLSNGAKTSLS